MGNLNDKAVNEKALVAVVLGSDSDLEVMKETFEVLKEFGVAWELRIISAHRSPRLLADYAAAAEERGLQVIIAAAGMAAHLPGVIAAYTCLPVIGVPIKGGVFSGLDALFSIVQMPPGVPVATVAVNGSRNAALLAVQILSIKDLRLRKQLSFYKEKLVKKVAEKSENAQRLLSNL